MSLIITSSCSGISQWPSFGGKDGQTGNSDTPFSTKVHTGLYGIEAKFVANQPQNTVYYTGNALNFPIMLEVRNRGATTVDANGPNKGYVYLSGYDPNIIQSSIIQPRNSVNNKYIPLVGLDAVSNFNPEGGYTVVEFNNIILPSSWPHGTDVYEPTFRATVCYDYETTATPILCIDPHPFSSLDEKKICRIRNVALAGGQGGPIEITSVDEEAAESTMYIKIHISNSQVSGTVFDSAYINPDNGMGSCPNLLYNWINKVDYTPPYFQGSGTGNAPELKNCKPESPLRLVDGKATIFCEFNVPSGVASAYETPLNIKLKYGYMTYEEKKITIKNAESS